MLDLKMIFFIKFQKIVKKSMDFFGATSLLIITSPVCIILCLVISSDGGKVFFGHTRIGYKGKPFKCWKFRTMVPDAQEVLDKFLENDNNAKQEWQKNFKLKKDPRITKIGKFLRKTSLDELPQLFNVLIGEMSLVGPRPIIESEKVYYRDKIKDYISVKPGITGLWQVSGRNDTTYKERVELDSRYIRNWSLWLDIVILFKTLGVMINKEGAY